MKLRKAAVQQMKGWLVDQKVLLNLNSIHSKPGVPVDPNKLNAIHIHVGADEIVKRSRQFWHGYPVERQATVIFEMWMPEDAEPEAYAENVRKVLLSQQLDNNCRIQEQQTYGPINGGIPGSQAMQLFMTLSYSDNGLLSPFN